MKSFTILLLAFPIMLQAGSLEDLEAVAKSRGTIITKKAVSAPYEPKVGSAERKAILDALRLPVDATRAEFAQDVPELRGKKVVFTVDYFKVQHGYAFIMATFTPSFAEDVVSAVLKLENDHWVAVDVSFADDVPHFSSLAEKTNAPMAIFPVVSGEE